MNFITCETFRFSLKATSPISLPAYKGAVFRGAFGTVLRKTVCAVPVQKDCVGCLLRPQCPYVAIFEPAPPDGFADAGKYGQAPRPYIINPPPGEKRVYKPGEILDFDVVLMGRAIKFLPYFIYTFNALGDLGLGKDRGKYTLEHVAGFRNKRMLTLYDHRTKTLSSLPGPAGEESAGIPEPADSVTLRFVTPLRLKVMGRLVTRLDFPVFFESLARRLVLLSAFYGDPQDPPDVEPLLQKAGQIKTAFSGLHWFDWERFSTRQKTLMKFGGLKGQIRFSGDLDPFMPLLHIGQAVNAGQSTTFGLGKYVISSNKPH